MEKYEFESNDVPSEFARLVAVKLRFVISFGKNGMKRRMSLEPTLEVGFRWCAWTIDHLSRSGLHHQYLSLGRHHCRLENRTKLKPVSN